MEICITYVHTNLHIIQILNENTYVTYTSIHSDNNIIPIQINYKKAISVDLLLSDQGLKSPNGDLYYNRDSTIIDVLLYKNLLFLQMADKLIQYNQTTKEEQIIFQGNIESVVLQYPKIAIENNFYYIFDLKARNLVRVGNTEKTKKIGCAFYQQFLFCGRTNGILWKSTIETGEVLNSYKFKDIRFNEMHCIQNYLINHNQNSLNIIDLQDMSIFKTISFQYDTIFYNESFIKYYFQQKLYQIEILPISDAFQKLLEQKDESKIIQLFKQYQELQSFENAIKLAKTIDCSEIKELITNLIKKKQIRLAIKNITLNCIQSTEINITMDTQNKFKTVLWPYGQEIRIALSTTNIKPLMKQIQQQLNQQKQQRKLEKILKYKLSTLVHLDLNVVHQLIISNLNQLKRIGLDYIQRIMQIRCCSNLMLENYYFYKFIDRKKKNMELEVWKRIRNLKLVVN